MENSTQIRKFAIIILILFGCAQKADKEISRKIANEVPVSNLTEFTDQSDRIINEADNISDAQRAKLIVLRRETLEKTEEKDKEEMRLRLALLREVLKSDYNKKEVHLMKIKIRKLGQQKYSLLMNAMKESNLILDRPYDETKDAFDFDHTGRDFNLR